MVIDPVDKKTSDLFASTTPVLAPWVKIDPLRYTRPGWAEFENGGTYRYLLGREWEPGRSRLLFVGLNPSMGRADEDDRTIQKVVKFAHSWGHGSLEIVNVLPFCETDSEKLRFWDKGLLAGPCNPKWVKEAVQRASCILVGWGEKPAKYFPESLAEMLQLLPTDRPLYCVKQNYDGSPSHPLYIQGRALPLVWRAKGAAAPR